MEHIDGELAVLVGDSLILHTVATSGHLTLDTVTSGAGTLLKVHNSAYDGCAIAANHLTSVLSGL